MGRTSTARMRCGGKGCAEEALRCALRALTLRLGSSVETVAARARCSEEGTTRLRRARERSIAAQGLGWRKAARHCAS